jgi:hypothetical protein
MDHLWLNNRFGISPKEIKAYSVFAESLIGQLSIPIAKGSLKIKFTFLRVEAPVWQVMKALAYRDMSSFRNAAGRDEWALKNVKLFFREP